MVLAERCDRVRGLVVSCENLGNVRSCLPACPGSMIYPGSVPGTSTRWSRHVRRG